MNAWSRFIAVAAAGCLSVLVAGTAASAAEITVVASGGPLPDVLGTLMPMFEKATGNKVKISFKGEPAIAEDIKQGLPDLVITNTEVVDDLATGGAVTGKTLLMISKVGIAVKAGASKPDVSTPDKLKAALLAAKTVGYSQGASGRHFATVLEKLGIADAIKPKAVVVQGPTRRRGRGVRRGRDRLPAGRRTAAGRRGRPVRRTAARAAEGDPLLRRHPCQGQGCADGASARELPAVRTGLGGSQEKGDGRSIGPLTKRTARSPG
jgi:hypothetical protein